MNESLTLTDPAAAKPSLASTCSVTRPWPFVLVVSCALYCTQNNNPLRMKDIFGRKGVATSTGVMSVPKSATSDLIQIPQTSIAELVILQLKDAGLSPTRVAKSDDSTLLEYRGDSRACVDIYPTGEIIVVYTKGDKDIVYELTADDLLLIPSLIRDAGVTV